VEDWGIEPQTLGLQTHDSWLAEHLRVASLATNSTVVDGKPSAFDLPVAANRRRLGD
jgi:hypothetical protein